MSAQRVHDRPHNMGSALRGLAQCAILAVALLGTVAFASADALATSRQDEQQLSQTRVSDTTSTPAGLAANIGISRKTPLPPPSSDVPSASRARRIPKLGSTRGLEWLGSLLAILAGFWLVLHWAARRHRSGDGQPSAAFELVGRWPLSRRHDLQLVRVGSRLLLLSLSEHTAQKLVEINDPQEIQRLLDACRWSGSRALPLPLERLVSHGQTQTHSTR